MNNETAILICLLDHADETPLVNIKMESQRWPENPISEKFETQYVAMVRKLLSSYLGRISPNFLIIALLKYCP